MPESLMDIKQIAAYLQMNKMTIYKLARTGRIPAFKVASEWRFKKELIDEWLTSQLKGYPKMKTTQAEPNSVAGKTVLVVDDEKVIRDFFKRTLVDYRILTAASGEEALEIVKNDNPDLVLLDIKMPGIDGIRTLQEIKKINKDIAVIMLSAYATLKTNLEAAKLGAYDSIAKPFDLSEMKTIISEAFIDKSKPKETAKSKRVKTKAAI